MEQKLKKPSQPCNPENTKGKMKILWMQMKKIKHNRRNQSMQSKD